MNIALQALADPTRREIFERISRQPSVVGQLADQMPVSRPAVSQTLAGRQFSPSTASLLQVNKIAWKAY